MALARPTTEALIDRPHMAPMQAKASRMFRFWSAAYLACGLVALSVGAYYINAKDEGHRAFVVTAYILRIYVFLGLYFITNATLGIFASMAPLKRKRLLYCYTALIALIIFIMVVVSICIWTRTLNINGYYADMWRNEWSDEIKLMFEDQGQCCGFLSRNDSPVASSASCKDESIQHGCMYPVIFYAQHSHRYIYAGLISFCLVGLGCIATSMLLIIDCSSEHRVRLSQSHYWRKRAASKAADI
ncbi:hypothetical protein LPJ77_001146 [Coemansia sp. RSA 2523]|nr:hypothetical protein LPJ69_001858 [Coemansia sp. RSA 1752]KAJ1779411.1 hypothetical protein LPJ54_000941 [Coemansia sp. RSA 1824]KAJ1789340.1 hypothetical protein LPJ62_002469 [Coemansia sp. RSA 2167]KAJ1810115.1 hypothetical protein LPJ77_001146 [Coemansia sp. RSA 2523]KAJ2139715.1 hypothetical protein GGH17_000291 [Coemansia sp. RSA 788]KAJ2149253.1 hypothetical protein IW142_000273 [Coemansia sp. RSA 564]KAJ2168882.1 hypothetical protein GGH15_001016 [Coemansia sp. RSA 562]KAJ2176376.1